MNEQLKRKISDLEEQYDIDRHQLTKDTESLDEAASAIKQLDSEFVDILASAWQGSAAEDFLNETEESNRELNRSFNEQLDSWEEESRELSRKFNQTRSELLSEKGE